MRNLVFLAACLFVCGCAAPVIERTVVFAEDSDSCHYYRIPAMCLDKDGNIVAVIDRRYESLADLGYRSTSIDISTRRSTDGGRTWGPQTFIARGDTTRYLGFGFGDASLTLTNDALDAAQAEALYRGMGRAWRHAEGLKVYVLTSSLDFEKSFGRRAAKRRKLYNGRIPCQLYMYF